MGKKYVIDETTLTAIANKMRDYTGIPNKIFAEDMHYWVVDVYNAGNSNGYEAGKQAEYDAFWDAFQNYGNKKKYDRAFYNHDYQDYNHWNKNTIRPKYDLIPTSADRMFYRVTGISNLEEHFQELGVKIDFSKSISLALAFCYGDWVTFPTLDCSSASMVEAMFSQCYSLETIGRWLVSDKLKNYINAFGSCIKLKNIIVEGVIAVSISFSTSPLTVESMLSIITHLKDYSGTENAGAYTLTLKDSCKTLMAEQGVIDELGGKTYDQYITDIGWNLA